MDRPLHLTHRFSILSPYCIQAKDKVDKLSRITSTNFQPRFYEPGTYQGLKDNFE